MQSFLNAGELEQFDYSQMSFPNEPQVSTQVNFSGHTSFAGQPQSPEEQSMYRGTFQLPASHQHNLAGMQNSVQGHHLLMDRHGVLNEPVLMRTDNYPTMMGPVLTEMQNTIAALQAQVKAATASAETAKATASLVQEAQVTATTANRKIQLKSDGRKNRVQVLIQNKARWALGIGGRNVDGTANDRLPHALQPGEEAELLEDEKTKKAHPNWATGVSDPNNLQFCIRIKNLVMEHVNTDNKSDSPILGNPTEQQVLVHVKTYYKTLRRNYLTQTTERGRARDLLKRKQSTHRSRKHEKADDHCSAVQKFEEKHGGAENTVGDYDLILTDDMSSERSDNGNAPKDVFDAHRKASGAGEHGWEVRTKSWRSPWTIRRQTLEDSRALGASGSLTGKHRVPRFKCLPQNVNDSAPSLVRKKVLYKSMVSKTWMEKTGTTYEQMGAVPDPPHFTIFKLQLDIDGLHKTEKEYLADDEA
ncbi:hypothetical protein B0H15DRAFT_989160 [Mycena belliarum]|uniref:Uncharacterized protein n=1 Tax=Mycena belliarum TaxID=1033014 RepID=A0AAD6XKC4_9AGAR|nr:hypothetical protein B0H15DRAFT_989160 [Mycena belliae]